MRLQQTFVFILFPKYVVQENMPEQIHPDDLEKSGKITTLTNRNIVDHELDDRKKFQFQLYNVSVNWTQKLSRDYRVWKVFLCQLPDKRVVFCNFRRLDLIYKSADLLAEYVKYFTSTYALFGKSYLILKLPLLLFYIICPNALKTNKAYCRRFLPAP